MEQNQNAFTPEAATDEPAFSPDPAADGPAIPRFDPVPLRYRRDGLTPEKQRDYVEALADCGVAREAAARVGVSEQAINRVRRRADARSFDLACEAAARFSARQIRSIAFERAIEGTVKRHYYHGELKSEETVYDNRLLIYLLGKLDRLLEPPPEADEVAANWELWMEAVEKGLAEPPKPPPPPRCGVDENGFDGSEVWEEEDGWWTDFPPPAGFDGEEEGEPCGFGYKRTLSEAEQEAIDAEEAEERAEFTETQAARRDLYFGFEGGSVEEEVFSPREAETLKLPPKRGAQQRERPADGSATPNPVDVARQWSRGGPLPDAEEEIAEPRIDVDKPEP